MPLPFTAEFILGFLLMDLTFYYWHRANHLIPFFGAFTMSTMSIQIWTCRHPFGSILVRFFAR
jgi:hypothetical protein